MNKTKKDFDPKRNHEDTRKLIGYVTSKKASQKDYDRIGFMSGLEVHQQLKTTEKLFCHCPAGIYNDHDDFDAELIRHMRPTLSELGEYDGTALMEFKTRKEIVYRVKNETTCTYEVDDTPPFPVNKEALEISIVISLLSRLNIVGEVHVTRKQYLDGSIPTGFQRTAIIGVEGEIPLRNKKVRLIQLSLEEDSCREISDVGHTRVYKTDRLGMPLIETVTYPDMANPEEVKEACDYIRFLNRSTGMVRTGSGAGRQDVNVSCKGGTRIEIKGVAHTRWIPELTHNESFRQWALLNVRSILNDRVPEKEQWEMNHQQLDFHSFSFEYAPMKFAANSNYTFMAVNLPHFKGLLSHFTQPGKCFADEFSDRLKVIACIEKPNMTSSEAIEAIISDHEMDKIKKLLNTGENDAQIIFWGPQEDMKTALETIEERALMAFDGIPRETRKSFEDGTTIFERVLPGADRMYPDTDTAPIPLDNNYIEDLRNKLPQDVIDRYHQLKEWNVPEDTFTNIFKCNLYPLIEKIVNELKLNPVFVGAFFGHRLKFVEGHYSPSAEFDYSLIYDLFKFLKDEKLELELAFKMLPAIYEHPKMDFESVLNTINFKRMKPDEIISKIPFLHHKFTTIKHTEKPGNEIDWIMGQLRPTATGNIPLNDLHKLIKKQKVK